MLTKRYSTRLDGLAERMEYTGKRGTLLFLAPALHDESRAHSHLPGRTPGTVSPTGTDRPMTLSTRIISGARLPSMALRLSWHLLSTSCLLLFLRILPQR